MNNARTRGRAASRRGCAESGGSHGVMECGREKMSGRSDDLKLVPFRERLGKVRQPCCPHCGRTLTYTGTDGHSIFWECTDCLDAQEEVQ
jgi:hypothetical protein